MKSLKVIAKKHEAGVFDFLKQLVSGKQPPTVPEDKVKEFQQFKKDILQMYVRLNNAYKIYFLGAQLKQEQQYVYQQYRDESGELRERKVKKKQPSKKIDFKGKWKFQLKDDKTSLGQAIHSLYQFLKVLESTKIQIKKAKPQVEQKELNLEHPEKNIPPKEQQEFKFEKGNRINVK